MAGATIELRFTDADAERRFLATELPAAWERFESSEYWDQGWFWPYSHFADYDVGVDGGLVRLVFDGDPDGLVAAESERWEAFEGLTDWNLRRYEEEGFESLLAQQRDAKGEVSGEREYRYKPLTARLALAVREEFDEGLPAAPEGEDGIGTGMWSLVHSLYVQCGYDWYDETDASLRALQSRVKSIAAYRGEEAARDEYERIRTAWNEYESELETWLDEQPTGETTI